MYMYIYIIYISIFIYISGDNTDQNGSWYPILGA